MLYECVLLILSIVGCGQSINVYHAQSHGYDTGGNDVECKYYNCSEATAIIDELVVLEEMLSHTAGWLAV